MVLIVVVLVVSSTLPRYKTVVVVVGSQNEIHRIGLQYATTTGLILLYSNTAHKITDIRIRDQAQIRYNAVSCTPHSNITFNHDIIHTCVQCWYRIVLDSGIELEWPKTKPGAASGMPMLLQLKLCSDGLFESKLPRCSCLAMAQQSYSEKHTKRTEFRIALPVVPICGSGRAASATLFRGLPFGRLYSDHVLLVFFLLDQSNPGTHNPMFCGKRIIQNVTAGVSGSLFSEMFAGQIKPHGSGRVRKSPDPTRSRFARSEKLLTRPDPAHDFLKPLDPTRRHP